MSRIPTEQDLSSEDPKLWAAAVLECKTGNPYCGADGLCAIGGSCFINKEMTNAEALQEIHRLRKELSAVQAEVNQVRSLQSGLIGMLEMAKKIANQEGKSERFFALQQCLTILKRGRA